jgi:protein-L-isoaspartate(D-aspartate) O-methyltransferase
MEGIMNFMEAQGAEDKFAAARRRMVDQDLKSRGITDPGVLSVMGQIRRERFVPESYGSQAYADNPLPIGMGQTISQPYIVALMTQQLCLNGYCEVLELGTGSGYQTAILARLSKRIYSIERLEQLSASAQAVLESMGIDNVEYCVGDGTCGWPQTRTFDRVLVSAAAPAVPQPLLDCLNDGGVLVAPVGSTGVQELVVCRKSGDRIVESPVCDVRFVRLVGRYGFGEDSRT